MGHRGLGIPRPGMSIIPDNKNAIHLEDQDGLRKVPHHAGDSLLIHTSGPIPVKVMNQRFWHKSNLSCCLHNHAQNVMYINFSYS